LSLEEAVRGAEVQIRVPTSVNCATCKGTGAAAGTSRETCRTCGGHGQVRMQQGFFSIQQTCPACHGTGTVVKQPCTDCGGAGVKRETKTLSVKVPAGIDEGDQVRLAGEGEAGGPGTAPGDLYVQVRIKPHPIFQRDGNDLHCEAPVSFATLALGGEIEIPTIGGRAKVQVPPETQTGKVFRLRGKGVRHVRGGQVGDLYCAVKMETPVNLNKRQREILQEFDDLTRAGGSRHSPQESSWTDKIKHFFDNIVG
jgi:molecular chaperone DnaJ